MGSEPPCSALQWMVILEIHCVPKTEELQKLVKEQQKILLAQLNQLSKELTCVFSLPGC